uniref:Uncharacterized protein n=1 Tax=Anguilla anguilla TaxID=7936 RepID=A0A0E9U3V9_ANGAN
MHFCTPDELGLRSVAPPLNQHSMLFYFY